MFFVRYKQKQKNFFRLDKKKIYSVETFDFMSANWNKDI